MCMDGGTAEIGAAIVAVIEQRAVRAIDAKPLLDQYRRAVGADAIAPGAIGDRGDAETMYNRIAHSADFGALGRGIEVADITVVAVHRFAERRAHPWMKVRADVRSP
ncbi:MAG: hypothetical protein ABL874_01660 [Sphingopyxis sp.]